MTDDSRDGEAPFRFADLPSPLAGNVHRLGWSAPLPVQSAVIPILLAGRDVVVQSRTGSGKTGAFLLPICRRIDPSRAEVQALVLVPTRELCEQVHGVLLETARGTGIRTVAVYGGAAYGPQIEAFRNKAHVIVATPGRMIDHLMSDRVSLDGLRILVLDEADEMLSMGFFESMMRILSFVPEKRQTALFSATIPPGVARMARRFTRDPEEVNLSSDVLHVEEVDHIYYVTDAMYKDRTLLKIIEMENHESALIFCNTKREVEYLGVFLKNFGYDGDFLSGDLSQKERDCVMARIREGKLRFLVATDVAARGIDISALGCVVLYNLPQAHEHYIHRAGRTGRAGAGGTAISLVTIMEEIDLKRRAERFGIHLIKKDPPTDEEVEKKVAERLRNMVEEKYRGLSPLERERLRRFLPLARDFTGGAGEGETAAGIGPVEIVAMLLDRFYQETLRAPLYSREEGPSRGDREGDAAGPGRSRRRSAERPGGRSRKERERGRSAAGGSRGTGGGRGRRRRGR